MGCSEEEEQVHSGCSEGKGQSWGMVKDVTGGFIA
jgi:hypothetical protein